MQQEGPLFSLTLPYPLTRLQPDVVADQLALEWSTEAGEVILAIYFLKDKKLKWSEPFPVYYRLAGSLQGMLLVQSYELLDRPHEPKLLVLDTAFNVMWEAEFTSVVAFGIEELKVRKKKTGDDGYEELWVNVKNGKKVDTQMPNELQNAGLELPMLYPEGSGNFETVSRFIKEQLSQQIRIQAEYALAFGKIHISYYTEVGKLFQWHFVQFSEQGELLYKNCFEKAESASGTATFMIWNAYILTLPNQTTVMGYSI